MLKMILTLIYFLVIGIYLISLPIVAGYKEEKNIHTNPAYEDEFSIFIFLWPAIIPVVIIIFIIDYIVGGLKYIGKYIAKKSGNK